MCVCVWEVSPDAVAMKAFSMWRQGWHRRGGRGGGEQVREVRMGGALSGRGTGCHMGHRGVRALRQRCNGVQGVPERGPLPPYPPLSEAGNPGSGSPRNPPEGPPGPGMVPLSLFPNTKPLRQGLCMAQRLKWLAQRLKWLAQRLKWLAQRLKWLAQRFKWLAQRFKWLAQRFKWLAQRFKWVAQRFEWLAQRFKWLAQRFTWLAQRFTWLAQRFKWSSRGSNGRALLFCAPFGGCLRPQGVRSRVDSYPSFVSCGVPPPPPFAGASASGAIPVARSGAAGVSPGYPPSSVPLPHGSAVIAPPTPPPRASLE